MRTKRAGHIGELDDVIAAAPDDQDVSKLQDLREDLATVLERKTRL